MRGIGNNLGIKLNVVLTNLYYNGGEKMNNVKKYLGLLLMLPLFTISLAVAGQVETVDAKVDLTGPYFDLVDIQKSSANSENTYKAIFDVWAGDQNITDLKMIVKSDSETLETMAGSFNAGDHSITTVRIVAMNPDSISGEIIDFKISTGSDKAVSAQQVSGLTGSITPEAKSLDGSYFELYDLRSLGSDLYKVTLVMYTGSENSQNGHGAALPELGRVLHASSDNANEFVYVPRISANSQTLLSVIISADDPSTIKIQ